MIYLKIITLVCIALTAATSLISLSTNYWIKHDSTHHQGLYYFCNDEDVGCQEFDEDPVIKVEGMPDWHLAVFGLVIIAVVLHIVALICFLFICVQDGYVGCQIIVVVVLAISWIAITAGMGVYTQKFYETVDESDSYDWGHSFILGWLSFLLNIVSGVLAFMILMVGSNRNKK